MDTTNTSLWKEELIFDWQFQKSSITEIKDISQNKKWEVIQIPHDWDREGPFLDKNPSGKGKGHKGTGYSIGGIGWYKRQITVPSEYIGSKVFLRFGGIFMRSTLWLNEKQIGSQLHGYGPFELDISDSILYGEANELLILVDNSQQPAGRWYTGSGIFRKVELIIKHPIYFPWGGTFFTTPEITQEFAIVNFAAEIRNDTDISQEISVTARMLDQTKKNCAEVTQIAKVPANSTSTETIRMKISKPHLWDAEDPYLYLAEIDLNTNGDMIEQERFSLGIRKATFNGQGLTVNGKIIFLKGVCVHHAAGCVGSAVPIQVWERRFRKLKELGCNAIRTSHNPVAEEFLDLCDRMGFYIINESFDAWTMKKARGSWEGREFKNHWKPELYNFVRRDRNHPSVILWSLGNEIFSIHKKKGKLLFQQMIDFCKQLDPSRPYTTAIMGLNAKAEIKRMRKNKPPFLGDLSDVISLNYVECLMPTFHKRWPNKAMISTETFHYYRERLEDESHHSSAKLFDNKLFQGKLLGKLLPDALFLRHLSDENPWYFIEKTPYICGAFLWTGIEYMGEVVDPYPVRGWMNAPIKINGFLKPQSEYIQTVWKEDPLVRIVVRDDNANIPQGRLDWSYPKIVSHWNFAGREGESMEIWVYSNCDAAELFYNGSSLGVKDCHDALNHTVKWELPYKPGELLAIGRVNGAEKAKHRLVTAGNAARIELTPDRQEMTADGQDVVNIEIQLVDGDGNPVRTDDRELNVSVSGQGTLLGVDSGNLMRQCEQGAYLGPKFMTTHGQGLILVRSGKMPGELRVDVSGEGLTAEQITFQVNAN